MQLSPGGGGVPPPSIPDKGRRGAVLESLGRTFCKHHQRALAKRQRPPSLSCSDGKRKQLATRLLVLPARGASAITPVNPDLGRHVLFSSTHPHTPEVPRACWGRPRRRTTWQRRGEGVEGLGLSLVTRWAGRALRDPKKEAHVSRGLGGNALLSCRESEEDECGSVIQRHPRQGIEEATSQAGEGFRGHLARCTEGTWSEAAGRAEGDGRLGGQAGSRVSCQQFNMLGGVPPSGPPTKAWLVTPRLGDHETLSTEPGQAHPACGPQNGVLTAGVQTC